MNATISLENLLASLLTLSRSNQKWIADHLYENISVDDSSVMTTDDVLSGLQQGFREMKEVEDGKLKPLTMEEVFNEL